VNRSSHVFVPFENVLDRCRFCGNIESSHFSPSPIEVPQPTEEQYVARIRQLEAAIHRTLQALREYKTTLPAIAALRENLFKELFAAPIEAPRVEGELPPLKWWNSTCDTTLSGHRVIARENYAPYAYTCAGSEQEICDAVNERPKLEAEVERLKERLAVMTEDRNLWQGEHNEDCPNLAEVDRLRAEIAELKEQK